MDKEKQPGIQCLNVILTRLDFKREPTIQPKPELRTSYNINISTSDDKKKMSIEVTAQVEEMANSSFSLECGMAGIFSVDEDFENMKLEEYGKINGPALIFPYLREMISSVTAKSGMNPVILPPTNIVALSKEATLLDDNN